MPRQEAATADTRLQSTAYVCLDVSYWVAFSCPSIFQCQSCKRPNFYSGDVRVWMMLDALAESPHIIPTTPSRSRGRKEDSPDHLDQALGLDSIPRARGSRYSDVSYIFEDPAESAQGEVFSKDEVPNCSSYKYQCVICCAQSDQNESESEMMCST